MAGSLRTAALLVVSWVGLLVYAAGCGEGDGEGTIGLGAAPADPIAYKVFVGYPAVARSIAIDADGNAKTSVQHPDEAQPQRSEFVVPEDQLNEIRSHLAAAELGELPDEGVSDLVYATITYGDEEGTGGTAETPEENEDTPEDLRIAIGMLTDLMPPLEDPEAGDESAP